MASGQLLIKLRKYYSKADEQVREWASAQEESLALLKSISNIITRLPALQEASNYGPLQAVPYIQQKLLQKQILGLEQTFQELHKELAQLAAVCQALGKLSSNAQKVVQQDKRLTAAARARVVGPIPSIDQCLQGLQDIWRMHSDELQLKQAIVSEVLYGTSEADLQQLVALYAAQPNIDAQRVRDLLYLVAATEEVQRLL